PSQYRHDAGQGPGTGSALAGGNTEDLPALFRGGLPGGGFYSSRPLDRRALFLRPPPVESVATEGEGLTPRRAVSFPTPPPAWELSQNQNRHTITLLAPCWRPTGPR